MHLRASCPRCPTGLATDLTCPTHGAVAAPLWRPETATYDALAEHLSRAADFPTYLPWPLPSGWSVVDFGVVHDAGVSRATVSSVVGWTDEDGPIDLIVVSEEPGTGLGARIAGTVHSDPGHEIAADRAMARVRVESQAVPVWAIPTPEGGEGMERIVVAGEAAGRWLWLVLQPASAVMLLARDIGLVDISGLGAALLDAPFGGPGAHW
ncbi:DUF6758 family protein [Nocardioides sp. AE5]|uniref:DUF6758 family protein n=1 Tax=Nocardioides sp. AE5 TaxID=2962573 RepID=UPI0028824B80|nr:DUF6758 family protein [Nocardioides sp. AE5]MDT0202078.1 hypothetical protein [Nocardioides sp. AE5]